jgi:hypothetical protein
METGCWPFRFRIWAIIFVTIFIPENLLVKVTSSHVLGFLAESISNLHALSSILLLFTDRFRFIVIMVTIFPGFVLKRTFVSKMQIRTQFKALHAKEFSKAKIHSGHYSKHIAAQRARLLPCSRIAPTSWSSSSSSELIVEKFT